MISAIVVPTNRRKHINEFLDAWREEFEDHHVIVVCDSPTTLVGVPMLSNWYAYVYDDIDADLKDYWIIPKQSSCIRSYGIWKAKELNVDMIVTMDDDCYPFNGISDGFLQTHWEYLCAPSIDRSWEHTAHIRTRGLPILNTRRNNPTVINHGMWEGAPDSWAIDRLHSTLHCTWENKTIPIGRYFPMCSMNLAFRPNIAPLMYFLLMDGNYPYARLGDIWCGIIAKKICDHLGLGVRSGNPTINHKCASDVWSNLKSEAKGMKANETFWQIIDKMILTKKTPKECYLEIADQLPGYDYWGKLREAMKLWIKLW